MEKSLPEIENRIETLTNYINKQFNCNILERSRKTKYIYARMTFSFILRSRGYTFSDIADLLKMNHASIVNLMNKVDMYLKTDEIFRVNFNNTVNYFDNDRFIESLEKNDLKIMLVTLNNKIFYLEKENKTLKKQNNLLYSQQGVLPSHFERVKSLLDMVRQRTRVGSEEETLKKLNTFYNGLYIK
jgi:hypothetical protein